MNYTALILLWFVFTVIVAFYGDTRKLGLGWSVLISIVLSPLVGFIIAAASGKKAKVNNTSFYLASQVKDHISAGDYDLAKEKCLKIIKTNPDKAPNTNFQLACIYGHENDNEGAFFYLKKALNQGFSDLEAIRTHDDLKGLRATEQYKTLLTSV